MNLFGLLSLTSLASQDRIPACHLFDAERLSLVFIRDWRDFCPAFGRAIALNYFALWIAARIAASVTAPRASEELFWYPRSSTRRRPLVVDSRVNAETEMLDPKQARENRSPAGLV